jgi:Na+-transporting methylmalonyl-CoA/oxaloacetate decarboxylase gamma subunit
VKKAQSTADDDLFFDFEPSADLEVPTTAGKDSVDSVKPKNTQAAKEIVNEVTEHSENSPITDSWFLRFGIVFIFLGILIAYMKKENISIFSQKQKVAKKPISREHLDIYRSLNQQDKPSSNNRQRGNRYQTKYSSIDKSKQSSYQTSKKSPKTTKSYQTSNKPVNRNAVNTYKTQNSSLNKNVKKALNTNNSNNLRQNPLLNKAAKGPTNRANSVMSRRAGVKSGRQVETNSSDFLKNMAEIYKQSGRHDLGMNLQSKIKKNGTHA